MIESGERIAAVAVSRMSALFRGEMAGQATVLVIDDAEDVCVALTELLEEEGFAATTARDGRQALDLLLGGLRPCAILLDLMMPGMNGWDFRSAQMRDPELSAVPVVVVTASGFSHESIRTQFGPIELVAKPIQPSALLDVIERLTARPEPPPTA